MVAQLGERYAGNVGLVRYLFIGTRKYALSQHLLVDLELSHVRFYLRWMLPLSWFSHFKQILLKIFNPVSRFCRHMENLIKFPIFLDLPDKLIKFPTVVYQIDLIQHQSFHKIGIIPMLFKPFNRLLYHVIEPFGTIHYQQRKINVRKYFPSLRDEPLLLVHQARRVKVLYLYIPNSFLAFSFKTFYSRYYFCGCTCLRGNCTYSMRKDPKKLRFASIDRTNQSNIDSIGILWTFPWLLIFLRSQILVLHHFVIRDLILRRQMPQRSLPGDYWFWISQRIFWILIRIYYWHRTLFR